MVLQYYVPPLLEPKDDAASAVVVGLSSVAASLLLRSKDHTKAQNIRAYLKNLPADKSSGQYKTVPRCLFVYHQLSLLHWY